jgi:kynurenine formamidase
MRSALTLVLLAAAACTAPATWPAGEWIDLTHEFSADTIYWPTAPGFELRVEAAGMTEQGYWYAANSFSTAEHGGTHVDAPVHFAQRGASVDRIPLSRLIGPAAVIDASAQAEADRDYQVRTDDLRAWEARHGSIPPGAVVLLRTGFSRHWPDRERYLGTAERGPQAALRLSFPGLHPSAAQWLVEERDIAAIGIDTASIDHGKSRLFHSHRVLFEREIPAFENVAALDRLPPIGAWIIALPMKIAGGSGGPLRIVALVP